MSKYYLHYNSETGEIISVSNEKAINMLSIEIDVDTASAFIAHQPCCLTYIVYNKTKLYKHPGHSYIFYTTMS